MRSFKFRLQKVMETKQRLEDALKEELATALKGLELEEIRLRGLHERRETYRQVLREKEEIGLNVLEALIHHAYLVRLTEEIATQKAKVDQLEAEVEEIRQKLLEVSRAKRMLENLRKKRFEEFRKEIDRIEQSFVDELSQRRGAVMVARGG